MANLATRHELVLRGCSPEPLMAFLKALGILRLVAQQQDSDARACWREDTFVLYTRLDEDALVRFFLADYCPTPVVAPWNSSSGFYEKDNREAMKAILGCQDSRFQHYRQVIFEAQDIVNSLTARIDLKKKEAKELILAECRNSLPEAVLPWLDAAYVLTTDGPKYPPLLGTGGNDGRLEFSNNFMQNLVSALGIQDGTSGGQKRRRPQAQDSEELIGACLFGEAGPSLIRGRTTGQFSPGSVGGPNATVGFEGDSLTNPWDYVLMIEGVLMFAGAVSRRLSSESRARAVFPFTVEVSAAGYGTAVDAEYGEASRRELWVPLWDQPSTYREVAHVFAEGRAQLGSRQATTGADFARAIAGLGVERGIQEFVRFGFLMRSGRAYLATPLSRLRVRHNPKVDILFDIDAWVNQLRQMVRSKETPDGVQRVLRWIDRAILDFCQVRESQGDLESARRLQDVLIALGHAETWLARSRARDRIPPLSSLRADWLTQGNDGSAEFRLAAAVASIQGSNDGAIGPIRANLEPVTSNKGRWGWNDGNPSAVWHGANLLRDMAAVLDRRCLEALMTGVGGKEILPLNANLSVPVSDIQTFLEGRLDQRRIADLILPLSAIRWQDVPRGFEFNEVRPRRWDGAEEVQLPLAYAVIRLLFLPWAFRCSSDAPELKI
ncbi:MAG: type I-U CRISPR-associated protein Csx17 [Dehalococcoidia bacterium]|nr:type I-U CRISPR-associated protein Csx17 [Dehalococcoidia bacterium]